MELGSGLESGVETVASYNYLNQFMFCPSKHSWTSGYLGKVTRYD